MKVPSPLKKYFGPGDGNTWKMVAWSCFYFFCLLCSYFILRPLRDEMGIINGAVNMQWLFTGTFIAMLCIVPIFSFLVSKNAPRRILLFAYAFCIINILIFYFLFESLGATRFLAISFFIWLSVFNLFVVSLFWSFMSDVFSGKDSKRYFGLIAAGGSLGALTGPLIANYLSRQFPVSMLLLTACFFLILALSSIFFIHQLSEKKGSSQSKPENLDFKLRDVLEGVQQVFKSRYLLGIVTFVLLYTAVSTVLYFEQAHIVESSTMTSQKRLAYFSSIDFYVNLIAITGQFLLTGKVIRFFGLSVVLASMPLIMGIGLFWLGTNPSISVIATLMVLHRSGNFMLLRPGREILFTVTSFKEKYKAKNFIDTAIYRGGDALVGWMFAGFSALGLGLGSIAFLAAPVAFLWSFTGFKLGKQQVQKEKSLTLKNQI